MRILAGFRVCPGEDGHVFRAERRHLLEEVSRQQQAESLRGSSRGLGRGTGLCGQGDA